MSLLSYLDIVDLIGAGVVRNADKNHVNSASLDLTLGDRILVESVPVEWKYLDKNHALDTEEIIMDDGGYVLHPGEFILACTREMFYLPETISAEYKLKSSLARLGLEHLNAGWCDAGWNGSVLTLELKNMTQHHNIVIRPGDKIGQIVFFKHREVPQYASYAIRGSYNGDKTVSGVKSVAQEDSETGE